MRTQSCVWGLPTDIALSDGGLQRLHLDNDDTVNWLDRTALKALVEWISALTVWAEWQARLWCCLTEWGTEAESN